MQVPKTRGLYVKEKIKNFAYNFKYKALAFLEEYPLEEALSPYQTIYLLGKEYSSTPADNAQKCKELSEHFKKVLWITYRSGFPQLLQQYGYNQSFVTDTGWGCMIRVGQMLFAQILKNYLRPQLKEQYNNICDYFNDFKPESLFSIQKIAKAGKNEFDLQPGKWYNPAQIAYILSHFLNESKDKQLQHLKSLVFNNSSFFYDQALEMFKPEQVSNCCHKEDIPEKESCLVCTQCNKSRREVAVIILVRLGLDNPEPQYLNILNEMMSWKWFKGLLGGKPQKALYFIGRKEESYIYLDPHYVQIAKENTEENTFSYFCQSLRLCKNSTTDPSLGICFYLPSLLDLNHLYTNLQQLKEQQEQSFFIFLSDKTPEYALNESSYLEKEEVEVEESGEFQVI